MTSFFHAPLKRLFATLFAVALLLGDTHAAVAQGVRYLNRDVAVGKRIEFTWTNYDEATCRDNGYAKFTVDKKPKLGRFRVVRKKLKQQNGNCKGRNFSTLLITYTAGRTKGTDRAAFSIRGASRQSTQLNLKINVR